MPAYFGYLPPSFTISATAVSSLFFQMALTALAFIMLSRSKKIWVVLMTSNNWVRGLLPNEQVQMVVVSLYSNKNKKGQNITLSYHTGESVH